MLITQSSITLLKTARSCKQNVNHVQFVQLI